MHKKHIFSLLDVRTWFSLFAGKQILRRLQGDQMSLWKNRPNCSPTQSRTNFITLTPGWIRRVDSLTLAEEYVRVSDGVTAPTLECATSKYLAGAGPERQQRARKRPDPRKLVFRWRSGFCPNLRAQKCPHSTAQKCPKIRFQNCPNLKNFFLGFSNKPSRNWLERTQSLLKLKSFPFKIFKKYF
jgi:hypothetical protein